MSTLEKVQRGHCAFLGTQSLRVLRAITQQQVCNKEKEFFISTQHTSKASGNYGDQMNTQVPKRWDRVPADCRCMKQQAQPLAAESLPRSWECERKPYQSSPPFSRVSPHSCKLDRPGGVTHCRCSPAFISWGK